MRRILPQRDRLLLRIGAAKKEAGRAFGFVKIHLPATAESVTRQTFSFQLDKARLQDAEQRDGPYLLRSSLTSEDPAVLWTRFRFTSTFPPQPPPRIKAAAIPAATVAIAKSQWQADKRDDELSILQEALKVAGQMREKQNFMTRGINQNRS